MRLKKLIIHGFKSFADHVELSFDGGITGVVGPNGCGKSNISDAVRWVLGEQSARSLRGAKMEDVIFNGTEKRRRLAFCEVSLVFDNEDHRLPIDFVEVSVTRRVYRSGEAEYRINGAACRLRDIVDLFRDTGIGRDGYSLIGQGRIDEILSQKSEDRRNVFEEAAGIVKYKARKQEAQRRMEHTRDNLSRVEDILSELEARLEPLREQSETAREYLSLRDELKVLELNLYLLRSVRYQERIAELKANLETYQASIDETEASLAAAQERRSGVQDRLSEAERLCAEKRESVQRLIREVEALEGASQVLKERISALTRERDRLEAQETAARDGGEGIRAQLIRMTDRISAEQTSIQEAQKTQQAAEATLEAAEQELSEMEQRAEEIKQQIIDAMNRLSDVRAQRARLTAMQTALETQLARLDEQRAHDDQSVQSLREQAEEAQSQLDREEARRRELAAEIEKIAGRLTLLNEQNAGLAQQINDLQTERQQKDSRLRLLREMQRDYEGYNHSVKQVLLQARRQGQGIHGVVADLIHVPEELERAIDMVLGGALQNIVVDRDEDAKRMIDYLRANRFGRATFLPIASVRGRTLSADERRVLSMPGCVGLASELIEFDPKYQGIVDNLLGRTVIAEDLTTGIPIQRAGRYAFRLVTLAGDVMHSGGSMTGGSVQSRMTSLLSRSREIKETEEALASLNEKLSGFRQSYAEAEEQRGGLKRERQECYDALHQQEVLCARAEAQLKAVAAEQAANDERVQRTRQERDRLAAQLEETVAALEKQQAFQQTEQGSTDEQQAAVRSLQEEIYQKRSAVEAQRASVTDGRVALASRAQALSSLESEKERFERDAQDTQRLLAESKSARETCLKELEEQTRALETTRADLAGQKAALNESRTAFDAEDAVRTKAQSDVAALTAEIDRFRQVVEESGDRRHRAELQLTRVEAEFQQMESRIWEDYELTYAGAEAFRQEDFKVTDADRRVAAIRRRIKEMGSVNVASVEEYRQTAERVEEMSGQRDDLTKAEADLQRIVEELEQKMDRQFREEFEKINQNFQRTFVRLFGGGKAALQLSDPSDALNCGIEVVAQPPGKKLQMLTLLSGGERALTAIAILFAILDLKPTPFCILDEIEAALDDANIDTYADYLKAYSENTQFIVITHRKGTMERCDALYGVVMEEKGISKTVSVQLNEAV